MISKLKGIVDELASDAVVLNVNGVCYYVMCSSRTLSHLSSLGESCTLFTEMIVREDAMMLFGFYSSSERQWFRLLTTVQGVGNRVALALLSIAETAVLGQAIMNQDKAFISQADGVGPKLAARIITELKDKVHKIVASEPSGTHTSSYSFQPVSHGGEDAVAALVSLGYKAFEANAAIRSLITENENTTQSTQELIRLGLAKLGK